jgi:Zn-dependent protease with chaperone function
MFAARGVAVSLSVFVLVYCALSLAVGLTWRRFWGYSRKFSIRYTADLLFSFRMFPILAATVITAAFTIPSFLLLEPRAIDEPLGGFPMILGLCGLAFAIAGIVNAAVALRKASRAISTWTTEAQPMNATAPVPVLRISRPRPAMTAAGIVSQRVLVSCPAESMLSATELQTALNHEIAHVRRRDNLRKLLLRLVAFPGMRRLENAWFEATEMAADDAAVTSASEALDLAAALIKLSRIGAEPSIDLTAALVHSTGAVMNARVERLLAWRESRQISQRRSAWYGLAAALATIAIFSVTYTQLLAHVHTATEWLVR